MESEFHRHPFFISCLCNPDCMPIYFFTGKKNDNKPVRRFFFFHPLSRGAGKAARGIGGELFPRVDRLFYFNPRLASSGPTSGSRPRKFLYICMASSMPPGVKIAVRKREATSGWKRSPLSL